jgi:cytoskeletal protein RodZ
MTDDDPTKPLPVDEPTGPDHAGASGPPTAATEPMYPVPVEQSVPADPTYPAAAAAAAPAFVAPRRTPSWVPWVIVLAAVLLLAVLAAIVFPQLVGGQATLNTPSPTAPVSVTPVPTPSGGTEDAEEEPSAPPPPPPAPEPTAEPTVEPEPEPTETAEPTPEPTP